MNQMRTKLSILVVLAGLLLAAVPVWAHHAFAAELDGGGRHAERAAAAGLYQEVPRSRDRSYGGRQSGPERAESRVRSQYHVQGRKEIVPGRVEPERSRESPRVAIASPGCATN